ncbi:MAG: hypothetical protein ACREPQ_14585 [Rhodanobacter sp.]
MKKVQGGVHRRNKPKGLKVANVAGRCLMHVVLGAVLLIAILLVEGLVDVAVRAFTHWVNDAFFTVMLDCLEKVVLFGDSVLMLWWLWKSLQHAIKEMSDE